MDVTGTWYNELGSHMVLQINGKNIIGKYVTGVGNATGEYDLRGQIDTDNDESTAIGWVVLWNNQYGSSDSITTWSGQVQVVNGHEIIVTTWLLTTETDSDDDWHSTLIGKDRFTRVQPTPEMAFSHSQAGIKPSFPKNA